LNKEDGQLQQFVVFHRGTERRRFISV
jgi:hypothetical protein